MNKRQNSTKANGTEVAGNAVSKKAKASKTVADASFVGVNAAMRNIPAPLKKQPPDQVWAELETLFTRWQDQDRGYTARLALFLKTDQSHYDHLSRYGDWDTHEEPLPVVLK
jgi:hypothetical protein